MSQNYGLDFTNADYDSKFVKSGAITGINFLVKWYSPSDVGQGLGKQLYTRYNEVTKWRRKLPNITAAALQNVFLKIVKYCTSGNLQN